jgi:DNA-binding NtrC family response regulator
VLGFAHSIFDKWQSLRKKATGAMPDPAARGVAKPQILDESQDGWAAEDGGMMRKLETLVSELTDEGAHPAPESRLANILVVDDDPGMGLLATRVLGPHGYRVNPCTNSFKALSMLREDRYGCVLLDLHMPGLQGSHLLPIIKHNFADLPVVIISGHYAPTDAGYYCSLGADELLAKPFDPDLLVRVVKRVTGVTDAIPPLVLTSLSLAEARDQAYRTVILAALRQSGWNQVKASELLGISRYSLIRWLRKLNISY